MNDREQAITTLTEHLDHWKRLLSEGVCCEVEGKQTIDALTFAIESIKVDRAYDLAYEKVDFIEIPEGATNRDVIRATFDRPMATNIEYYTENYMLQGEWLDSPYRKEQ